MLRALKHWMNRVAAEAHLRCGIRLYRSGSFERSVAHIQASVLLAGPTFSAHLYLGRIYLRLGRFDRARQEFAQARFLDPGRFAAQGLPEDLLLDLARRFYQPLWAGPRNESDDEPGALPCDDFSSSAERDRFRALPPIQAQDLMGLDLEDLGNRLLD